MTDPNGELLVTLPGGAIVHEGAWHFLSSMQRNGRSVQVDDDGQLQVSGRDTMHENSLHLLDVLHDELIIVLGAETTIH
jgi:hypothetical protein